jgi:Na+/melibiose symporter-like transporter
VRGGVLRRNQAFRSLWAAQTVSVFGDAVTLVALPTVAVLVLDAGAFAVGALTAAGWAAWAVFGLVAGVWVDRLSRRPLMVLADSVRVLLLASVPAAYAFELLTIWQLLAVAALAGIATVVFGLAYTAHVPEVVDARDLAEANARLEVSRSAAALSGPGLAGVLIGAAGAPVALFVDAISFAASALLLKRVPDGLRPAPARTSFRGELWSGVAELLKRPPLIASAAAAAIANFGLAMTQALIFVFAYRGLGLRPGAVGAALTIGAVGNVGGALIAQRLTRRLGTPTSLIASTTVEAVAGLLMPLALLGAPVLWLGLALAIRGVAGPLWEVNAVTLRQVLVPLELQARVTAAARTLAMGSLPLGALVGGAAGAAFAAALGTAKGTAAAIAVASGVGALSALPLVWARLRGFPPVIDVAPVATE